VDHLAAHGLGERTILVLGVDHDTVRAIDELPHRQQLAEEALARAGGSDDRQIGVVQRAVERVEQHRCLANPGDADEHAGVHGQGGTNERQRSRQRAGVQVARHQQRVARFWPAAREAALLFPESVTRVREQRVQLLLDTSGELVELAECLCPQQHVQAYREHALLASLQALPKSLSVLERDFPFGVGNAFAAQSCQP